MNIHQSITDLVGGTPLVAVQRIIDTEYSGVTVALKLEFQNPGGSVKDRIAVAMIDAAERSGELKRGGTVVEATSGNTGIGLAMVAASRGYKSVFVMPASMSSERKALLKAFGAELILSDPKGGMKTAVNQAQKVVDDRVGAVLIRQFENQANPEIHRTATAQEIWADTDGKVDVVIAGIGTGGTITGVSQSLKALNADIKMIGVEPAESPILNGGKPGPHKIQGLGANFVPHILDTSAYDEIVDVDADTAVEWARKAATQEGILVGLSSGAALAAANQIALRPENAGKLIVVIIPSFGERYLSSILFEGLVD